MKFSTTSIFVLAATLAASTSASAVSTSEIPTNATEITSTDIISEIQTTVLTITDCGNKTCTKKHVTTGVTVVTETREQVVTEYTTFCPLTTSKGNYSVTSLVPATPISPAPTTSEKPAPKSKKPSSTYSSILEGNAATNSLLGLTPAVGLVLLFMF